MKRILLILMLPCCAFGAIPKGYAEKMAGAIYQAEGGTNAAKPYGVLSVKVRNKAQARRVCIRSIRNNWSRWEEAGKPGTFVDFMADRWCPPSTDAKGNANWKKNVKTLLNQ